MDALTTDPRAEPVLARYPSQYIPTSVFVGVEGEVVETHIGPLSAAELRMRLDTLLAAQ